MRGRQTDRQSAREKERERERLTDRQTDRQTDRDKVVEGREKALWGGGGGGGGGGTGESRANLARVNPRGLISTTPKMACLTAGEKMARQKTLRQARDGRDALARELYSVLFYGVIDRINHSLRSGQTVTSSSRYGNSSYRVSVLVCSLAGCVIT